MLYFDFINPYLMYMLVVFFFVFSVYQVFTNPAFFRKHETKIFLIVAILLGYTQLVRYVIVVIRDGFILQDHMPFYICRFSAVILLYYAITKDKRVESFLFFWGATGLAGIIYPNGPIENIANLTETFYIDHFLLAITPFYLIVQKGFKPTLKGVYTITLFMAILLYVFIPINQVLNTDYFYLNDQSIFGVIFPGLPSFIFATVHSLAAMGFFYSYYRFFGNKTYQN